MENTENASNIFQEKERKKKFYYKYSLEELEIYETLQFKKNVFHFWYEVESILIPFIVKTQMRRHCIGVGIQAKQTE